MKLPDFVLLEEDFMGDDNVPLKCRNCNKVYMPKDLYHADEYGGSILTCSKVCFKTLLKVTRKDAPKRVQKFLSKLSPDQKKKYLNVPIKKG